MFIGSVGCVIVPESLSAGPRSVMLLWGPAATLHVVVKRASADDAFGELRSGDRQACGFDGGRERQAGARSEAPRSVIAFLRRDGAAPR